MEAVFQQVYSILSPYQHHHLVELAADIKAQGNPGLMVVWSRVEATFQSDKQQVALPTRLASVSTEVKQLQQLAWEQMHLGHWKDVAVVWRDLYALACLLSSMHHLTSTKAPSAQPQQLTHTATQPTAAPVLGDIITDVDSPICAAFKCLDLGIMMGGPRFKPHLHSLIKWLEQQPDAEAAARHRTQQAGEEPTSKRLKVDDGQGEASLTVNLGQGDRSANVAAPQSRITALQTTGTGDQPSGSSSADVDVHSLPSGSLSTACTLRSPVPCLHLPSLEHFLSACMSAGTHGQPAVITGAMSTWPAVSRWQDMAYLRKVAGHRTVPVEVGQHYLAEGWGQRLMTLADFIDQHMQAEGTGTAPVAPDRATPTGADTGLATRQPKGAVDAGAVDEGAALRQPKGYLAQHPLFDQIPVLAQDVVTPEYCVLGKDEEEGGGVQSVNAWFGPAGTVTPLHTDPHHNLLCQVVGHKYVRLYSPVHDKDMYPFADGLTTNSSQVDLHQVDAQLFPTFASARYQDCVLGPGQMLYIPPGWWHFVQSCSTSFSVSFWWC